MNRKKKLIGMAVTGIAILAGINVTLNERSNMAGTHFNNGTISAIAAEPSNASELQNGCATNWGSLPDDVKTGTIIHSCKSGTESICTFGQGDIVNDVLQPGSSITTYTCLPIPLH